jgi:hypothetical protein
MPRDGEDRSCSHMTFRIERSTSDHAVVLALSTVIARDALGTRPPGLQKSYEMKPETPVSE